MIEPAANVRNDAERTIVRAAALHGDERAQVREGVHDGIGAAPERHQQRALLRVLRVVGTALVDLRPPSCEAVAQLGQLFGAENVVHVRRGRTHPVAVLLGQTSHDDQANARIGVFERLEVPHPPVRAAFRVVANRARVEDEHVGFLRLGGDGVPGRLGPIRDILRIRFVHLAAEGFDIDPWHVRSAPFAKKRSFPRASRRTSKLSGGGYTRR